MLKSMTGFGKAISETNGVKISVEIKSVNGKQFDLKIRMPTFFSEKEIELRALLSQQLERGSVETLINIELPANQINCSVNKELVKRYVKELKEIAEALGKSDESVDYLPTVMRFPEVLKNEKTELSEDLWMHIINTVLEAIEKMNISRIAEGKKLEQDALLRLTMIQKLHQEINSFEKKRIDVIKDRITKNLIETVGLDKVDTNRFEQEVVYYLEKIDFTEERVRLETHCNYFLQTLKEKDSIGKKLGFITQEIGREMNTIGSKASNADIQKIVVQMKDELEKIKEQLMNIL